MGMTLSKQSSTKPAIRAALYARISTLNHGQDPEVQLGELREFCQRRGFAIAQEYVDKGISGSREKRPALDKLLTDCRKRLVDAVVVYRYDRFARSLRQLVNALEEFSSLGIDFVSLHEGVEDRKRDVCSSDLRLVDAVVVYRYDRFARSLRQLVNALEEFSSLGIDFVSLHEGVRSEERRV